MSRKIVLGLGVLVLAAFLTQAAAAGGLPPSRGRVLVRGASIAGANGLMFDADDRLHTASFFGREILVMNPRTGRITERYGSDLGVETPDDITFGPDGSLYWTSLMTGKVGRLTPDGDLKLQDVAAGVNPITFSDDGRLFVGLCFVGDALYEVDPGLVEPPRLIAENLGWLNGMDWGPDGYLYGPIFTQGRLVRIDVDSNPVISETVASGFGIPAAVKFDSQGRLHAVDMLTGEVSRVDTDTGDRDVVATGLPGLDNLAFDSRDRLFISNGYDGSVAQVLPSGRLRTVRRGGLVGPGGVAVLPRPGGRESVFVGDVWTLREFSGRTGRQQSADLHNLAVPGGMTNPFTVSPDGDNLVLSSWMYGAVQVWNPDTDEVIEHNQDFGAPLNAIRFRSDLVVADLASGSVVQRGSDTGEHILLAEGLAVPAGLAATDDDLWVSDRATGTVWQIVADGVRSDPMIPVAEGLLSPEGLAVDLDGSLLVVDTGAARLARISLVTGEVTTVAEGLSPSDEACPAAPPTWIFSGVAVGPSGAIYVTGDVQNVLYRLRPTH